MVNGDIRHSVSTKTVGLLWEILSTEAEVAGTSYGSIERDACWTDGQELAWWGMREALVET